ncbi:hypothetical protein HAX54_020777, partial [Datura stramonium]|nr:hypothetical protein [Datura stramonium]
MKQYSLNSKKNDHGSAHMADLQGAFRGMLAGKQLMKDTMRSQGIEQEPQMERAKIQQNSKSEIEGNGPVPTVKPWATLLKKNRIASHGMALNYIPPTIMNCEIVVQLDNEE